MTQAQVAPARAAGFSPKVLASLVALPVLVMLGVATGVALGVRGADVQVLGMALVTAAVGLVPMLLDFGRAPSRRHLLLFFVLASFLVFFVLSVFTTYFFGEFLLQRKEFENVDLKALRPTDIVRGQTTVLVGLLAMLAGYAIPLGRMVPGGIPRPRRDWSLRATLAAAMVTIPLGWIIYLSSVFGFLPKRLGSGFIGVFANSTYVGIALLMLAYLRYRSGAALALMALMIPPTMAFNYFTSSKGLFFAPVAVSVIAYIVVKRRIQARWIVAAFIAMSLFYPIGEFQRQVILQKNTRSAAWALKKPLEVASRTAKFIGGQEFGNLMLKGVASTLVRFDGLGIATVIVRDCPSRVPYQGGWTIAQIFLSYIPRVAWKDKPQLTSGQWVTDNFAGGPGIISSTGATWIGELWFSFGWPGIVLGMFVMGIFIRLVHEVLFKPGAVMPTQLMAVIVLFMLPPTLGGALMSPINGVIFSAIPVVFMHAFIRIMSGTSRPPTTLDDESGQLTDQVRAGI